MPSHRLIRDDGTPGQWLLEWDDTTFVLKAPDGLTVLDSDTAQAHRLVEIYNLYGEGRACLTAPAEQFAFKPHRAAVRDLRALVDAGLRSDPDYRRSLREQARGAIPRGLAMLAVGGGLFGLYCCWAAWAPNPPGPWFRWAGGLIRLVLLLLLGVAVTGLAVCFIALRQLRRIARIERESSEAAFFDRM